MSWFSLLLAYIGVSPNKGELTMKLKLIIASMLAAGVVSTAKAESIEFTIINRTQSVVDAFYTSPVGVKDWEEDVFGKDVLEPGEQITITIKDGRDVCKYDLRFEFQGNELEDLEDTQNICELGEYTISQ
jgi:hypothetical protein